MPERTAKSQEQMSKSCWVSAQPVLHDASGTWLRVNSSGRSEKQEISDTPYMTHSIIESPQRDHETRKFHSELRPLQSTVGYFYVQGQCLSPPHHRSAARRFHQPAYRQCFRPPHYHAAVHRSAAVNIYARHIVTPQFLCRAFTKSVSQSLMPLRFSQTRRKSSSCH